MAFPGWVARLTEWVLNGAFVITFAPRSVTGRRAPPQKPPAALLTYTLTHSILPSLAHHPTPPCSPRLLLRHILSFRRRVSDSRYCSRSSRHTHRCLDFYSFIESYLYLPEFYYLLCLIHFELSGSPQREVLQFCSPSTAK